MSDLPNAPYGGVYHEVPQLPCNVLLPQNVDLIAEMSNDGQRTILRYFKARGRKRELLGVFSWRDGDKSLTLGEGYD